MAKDPLPVYVSKSGREVKRKRYLAEPTTSQEENKQKRSRKDAPVQPPCAPSGVLSAKSSVNVQSSQAAEGGTLKPVKTIAGNSKMTKSCTPQVPAKSKTSKASNKVEMASKVLAFLDKSASSGFESDDDTGKVVDHSDENSSGSGSEQNDASSSDDGSRSSSSSIASSVSSKKSKASVASSIPAASPADFIKPNEADDGGSLPVDHSATKASGPLVLVEHSDLESDAQVVAVRQPRGLHAAVVNVPAATVLYQIQQSLRRMNHRLDGLEKMALTSSQSSTVKIPPNTFPAKTPEAFSELEEKLKQDEEFKKAVVFHLARAVGINPEDAAYELVKMCLSRTVAMTYVLKSKNSKKNKFIETEIYQCIKEAIGIKYDRTTEAADCVLNPKISLALTRSPDWENGRNERSKESKEEAQNKSAEKKKKKKDREEKGKSRPKKSKN